MSQPANPLHELQFGGFVAKFSGKAFFFSVKLETFVEQVDQRDSGEFYWYDFADS
jgi:hypothetical protein